jgi:antitoxin (DNA-binding transcriptional repressor) of toxin-antitoxin stability system
MRTAGIRALKDGLSRYIRQLEPGESIAITDRGRVVAELRAAGSAAESISLTERYRQLVDQGAIRTASEAGDPLEDWPTAREVRLPPGTASMIIDEDRGG